MDHTNSSSTSNTESFDTILQTLINSISISTSDSAEPFQMKSLPPVKITASSTPTRTALKTCDNFHMKSNSFPAKNKNDFPNFWPQRNHQEQSVEETRPFSLENNEGKGDNKNPNAKVNFFEAVPKTSGGDGESNISGESVPCSSGSSSTTRRRFLSKSANKSGPIFKKGNNLLPKTAKSNKKGDGLEQDTNWMKVLEERCQGSIISKKEEFKRVNAAQDRRFTNAPIVTHDDDDRSSFMTEFHSRNIFTAGSSDATSIGWADDAVESESTDTLARQWAQVEQVFHGDEGDVKPEGMSDAIYQEVLLWRKAFNSKPSRRIYNRSAKMSIGLHMNENYLKPSFLQLEPADSYNVFDLPSPMSMQTICADNSPNSPSSIRGLSALTPTQELCDCSSSDLSLALDSGPSSFVQSWLENLTTNFNADESHYRIEETQQQSLPQHLETESFFEQSLSGKLQAKSQRPISSRYLNRTWGKGERSKIRSAVLMDDAKTPRGTIAWESENFDVDDVGASKRLGKTFENHYSASVKPRKPSAWSRYGRTDETENEEDQRKPVKGEVKQSQKNFISWLLFDENDENHEFDTSS